MRSFSQFLLQEKIDSKPIVEKLKREVEKEFDDFSKSSEIKTVFKRAIKNVLDDMFPSHYKNKVSARFGSETEGKAGIIAKKGELTVVGIEVSLVFDKKWERKSRKDFSKEIINIVAHELVHAEQYARANREALVKMSRASKPTESYKEYLSLYQEIEAWAAGAVQEIMSQNMNAQKIYNSIGAKDGKEAIKVMGALSDSFLTYYRFFGKSNEPDDETVWRWFLKKFTLHLEERINL